MNIGIISDVHNNGLSEQEVISTCIDNIINNGVSGILIAGDIGDYESRRKNFFEILKLKSEKYHFPNIISMLGNHDVRTGALPDKNLDPDLVKLYHSYLDNFNLEYSDDFMSICSVINGYYFICLNTDFGLKDQMKIKDIAIEWLDKTLQKASVDDKPIFLLTHQPFNFTHWRSSLFGGFGDQDECLKEILIKYPQVVCLCGHIHNGLGTIEFIQRPFGTLIEIPSLTKGENGVTDMGTGWLVKIQEDKLFFEAWDFYKNIHLDKYDKTLNLPTIPMLLKQSLDLGIELNHDLAENIEFLVSKEYDNDIPDGDNTYRDQSYYGLQKIYGDDTWIEIENVRDEIIELLKGTEGVVHICK